MTITCNLNCICINSDCSYKHFIQYKDRKIVKKFYDTLSNKSIEEPNNETRKKNCIYGQLCENKNCGFRHRLNYSNREKLTVLYKFNKICPSTELNTKSIIPTSIKSKNDNKNSFILLDDVDDIIIQPSSNKSWVDIVKNDKKIEDKIEEIEEDEDDGFYMKF